MENRQIIWIVKKRKYGVLQSKVLFTYLFVPYYLIESNEIRTSCLQLIHSLVDRIMEVMGTPFVPVGNSAGYYIEISDVSL